jgi:hypothetical protein
MEVDPRVGEAMSHVQSAALELIAAMRTALDVAEDLVGNPEALQAMVQTAAAVARDAMDGVSTVASNVQNTARPPSEPVQRINVDD